MNRPTEGGPRGTMMISRIIASTVALLLMAGCGSDNSSEPSGQSSASLTYYDDVAPILQDHCLQCHQEGGIGEFRLDDYATAKEKAALMAAKTASREMPPWSATSDGSCGDFAGSLALTDAQIDIIGRWAKDGAKEGKAHAIEIPSLPSIGDSTGYKSPNFKPIIQRDVLGDFVLHGANRSVPISRSRSSQTA